MQPLDLIGLLAARRIGELLEASGTRALFGIMGLAPAATSAIARHVAGITGLGEIEVFVHPSLKDGDIGLATPSTRTATWHRNHPTPGVRATIFSVPAAQVRAVEQSLSHVVRIDEAWLLERPIDWAQSALVHALLEVRADFTRVLEGLLDTELVVTPMLLAGFCTRVAATMKAGLAPENAIRDSLPALRLPRNSGDAKITLSNDRLASRQFFQRLRAEVQPFLYRRTREGETLAAGELRRRLAELEQASTLSSDAACRLTALCDDRNVREGQWSRAQAEAAEIPWDEVAGVFAQAKKTEKPTFGQDTRRLFDQEFRSTLTDHERQFLDGLRTEGATAGPQIDDFFENHRERLRKSPTLYRRWEKLVFKKPIEAADLVEGLLRLADRVSADVGSAGTGTVYVRLRGSEQASFWANDKLKPQLRYLRDRYRGLPQLLAPAVTLDFGLCWTAEWEEQPGEGAGTIQGLEFEAFVVDFEEVAEVRAGRIRGSSPRAQMTWRALPDALGYSFSNDLRWIRPEKSADAYLLTGRVSEVRRGRGGATGVDLESASSVADVHGMSQGALANPERAENLVGERFLASLAELEAEAIVTPAGATAISAAFDAFLHAYSDAIEQMARGTGLVAPSVIGQADCFGSLLATLREHAANEPGLRELWAPLLEIGVIEVEGRRPAAIVTGWHPLRLAEIGAKALQFADAMKRIATSTPEQRAGAGDYVDSRARMLAGTYYVDLGLTRGTRPRLLAETQRVLDCSLLEEAEGEGVRNIGEEGAKGAVESLHRISRDYLELRPHERSNFSIALLGAESDDIPVLLARSLSRLVADNPDVRCDLVITHDDPTRLRELYENQNRRMAVDIDASAAGDPAGGFLSRLRVSMVGADRLDPGRTGKASDLVLLQDVIARSASVRWIEGEPATDPVDFAEHVPTGRSKRLPTRKRSVESGLYLTAPLQPPAATSWTHALHDVLGRRATTPAGPWLPLRWVEFVDTGIANVLNRAHALAHWVVTFDRIADRRLIVQDDRRIIRYFSVPGSAHNVIVSAEVTSGDLGDRLSGDLSSLLPNASPAQRAMVLKKLHGLGARLSGAVVMRAAQWHNFAQELIGLVLATRRLEGLLSATGEHASAWFFLDDNRRWLDLQGEMADILVVDFASTPDGPLIRVVLAEAKYCTAPNASQHATTSMRQLEATYTGMHRRLLLPETSLDPAIWRNKIADMLLEQMDAFDTVSGMSQAEWIEALRQQVVPIEVSGHSMVFSFDMPGIHGESPHLPDADLSPEERRPLAQWLHGRSEVVEMLMALANNGLPPPMVLPKDWPESGTLKSYKPDGLEQDRPSPAALPGAPGPNGAPVTPSANIAVAFGGSEGDQDGIPGGKPYPHGGELAEAAVATAGIGAAVFGIVRDDAVGQATAPEVVAEVANVPEGEPRSDDASKVPAGIDEPGRQPDARGWKAPVATALARMSHREKDTGDAWLEAKVRDLQNALQAEGMDAPILESRLTPNSGLVYVGARTLTVNWLERRQTDLLTKHSIDIVRISPMPGRIAIAIRRPERSILHLADAWLRRSPGEPDVAERYAPLIGEKEDDGALLFLPLAADFAGQEKAAPHGLVSGNTGSGKGILVTNLILDLCAMNAPDELDLHLIDPKRGVDYSWARRLPHLKSGIVVDQKEARELLSRLVDDMEQRYDLISASGYRNVDQYNRRVDAAARLPRVVIFFDEVANWMQDDDFKTAVEALLNKIATKARAAGLHLFMAYQRADVQVMTMQLRTNLGNRLILRLPDEGSSKIALGEKGADKLLGKGHLIAKLDNDEKIYAQVPYIGDDEVEELADAIARSWTSGKAARP